MAEFHDQGLCAVVCARFGACLFGDAPTTCAPMKEFQTSRTARSSPGLRIDRLLNSPVPMATYAAPRDCASTPPPLPAFDELHVERQGTPSVGWLRERIHCRGIAS
jgi:hypothetical protein